MLSFAAYTPHSPLLIDSIGKEHIKKLSKTREAFEIISHRLVEANVQTLFVISAHSVLHEKAFSINLNDVYNVDFKEFGDHGSYRKFYPDLELITSISRAARTGNVPFVTHSGESLDYGSAVPLILLCKELNINLVPISYCEDDRKQHLAFGRILKEVAVSSEKRIGIIGSGDLSHSLTSSAPVGFAKEGKIFDEIVYRSIQQFSVSTLLSIDQTIVDRAAECGLKSLLVLFGSLEHQAVKPIIHSYEFPFGVGYLTAEFQI